jgi:hypothetical protein
MTRVVISQPMFFPWVGLLEQIRLADVYVHYDDVQFSKGSFANRVQIKTAKGSKWLTLPVRVHLGDGIRDVRLSEDDAWRKGHLSFLSQAFEGAPYTHDALELVAKAYARGTNLLSEVVVASMDVLLAYFEIAPPRILKSSEMGIAGKSWQRVLDIVKSVGGDTYVTGHGAREYMDHEAFERAGVGVEYLDYEKRPYPQLYGEFTPFVSALDLVANMGRDGRTKIVSGTKPWREFLRAT